MIWGKRGEYACLYYTFQVVIGPLGFGILGPDLQSPESLVIFLKDGELQVANQSHSHSSKSEASAIL